MHQSQPSRWGEREKEHVLTGQKSQSFAVKVSEVTFYHLRHVLFLRSKSLGPAHIQGEDFAPEHEYRWQNSMEATLEVGLLQPHHHCSQQIRLLHLVTFEPWIHFQLITPDYLEVRLRPCTFKGLAL